MPNEPPGMQERRREWFLRHYGMPWEARLKGIEEARAFRLLSRHAPHVLASPDALTVQAWSGNTWTNIGPTPIVNSNGNLGGRIGAIAVNPSNSSNIFIGGADGGVWRTKDGGTTWAPLTDQLAALPIGSIAIDPSNPSNVYAGTGDMYGYTGVGLLKSTNGGDSWTLIGQPFSNGGYTGQRIASLAVSPTNSQILLAGVEYASASQSMPGIYRSTNAGANWTRVLGGPVGFQVLFHPTNGNIAYAVLAQGDNSKLGVYESTDAGQTWNPANGTGSNVLALGSAYDLRIAISPSSPTTLYAGVTDGKNLIGLYRTSDSGTNWTKLTATPDYCKPQCAYSNVLAVSPTDPNTVYAGGLTLVRTTNGGSSWQDTHSGYVDHHALAYPSASKLLAGNDGGMWTTANPLSSPPTWTSLNTALSITQFYPGISIHPTNINLAYGGAQDTGIQKYTGAKGWPASATIYGSPSCGDVGWTAFDYSTPNTAYMANCNREIFKTTDGSNWYKMVTGINNADLAEFQPPLVIDPVTPQRLYFVTYRVYQSINGAGSWTPISGNLSGSSNDAISDIAVAPSNTNYVYTVSSAGKFYVTSNASAGTGAIWTDRSAGLPGFALQGLAVDPHNEQIVYTATMGFAGARLFRSTSAGQSWTDITGNLPSIPIDSLAVDPDMAGTIYVGTEQGVYASVDNGASWQPLGTGLPLVLVTSIRVHHATRTLRVGTYGRGMWDLSIPLLAPALSISKTHSGNFSKGQSGATYTVTVTNSASGGPTSGTVTVTETLPSGLTMAGMSGSGWSCSGNTCTRSDALAPGASYPTITVTVNVAGSASSPQVNQVGVSGGGSSSASITDSTTITAAPSPALSISKSHSGNFTQGQTGATYTVTVTNAASASATSGTVTVTETLPSGLTMAGMSGGGWNCSGNTCTRGDALSPGASYPAITVTVNVAASAASPQVNQVGVSGGGSSSASITDSTTISTVQAGGTLSVSRNKLNFGISGAGSTSPQSIAINFTGGSASWTASSNQSNITVSPTSGSGNGSVQISAAAGSGGTVTITAPGATNSPQQVQVSIINVTPGNAFGSFDTPANNTTGAIGSIAVTGWALDNIEVVTLGIYREPLAGEPPGPNGLNFIGNAVFVVGARPDVEAQFPNVPYNYRAGWGYMLLSNFLPNGGNGTFKLHALATNKTGSTVDLGTRTVTFDNAHAAKPFGTLDTPAQGGTASGSSYANFGWALTPPPGGTYKIPIDGSTMTVYLDGAPLAGHPTYNNSRPDIASLFPGYTNTSGAVGYYILDTTKLSNGTHSISWIVYDNGGRGEGLGSRYFTASNGSGAGTAPAAEAHVRERMKRSRELTSDTVTVRQTERLELRLGAVHDGHLVFQGERRALPAGSTLDAETGVFYWQVLPPFLGDYELEFTADEAGAPPVRLKVRVVPQAL